MFKHQTFTTYEYEKIPLGVDCYLMDVKYIKKFEGSWLKVFNGYDYEPIGYVAYVTIKKINENSLELIWYPDIFHRFHMLDIILPKSELIACIDCNSHDEKPHLFVNGDWLNHLHIRQHSIFGYIDAIDMKKILLNGELSHEKLINLRSEIDKFASIHPNISFISFADNVLLKTNWTAGHFKKGVAYDYHPEIFLELFKGLQSIYRKCLNLDVFRCLWNFHARI